MRGKLRVSFVYARDLVRELQGLAGGLLPAVEVGTVVNAFVGIVVMVSAVASR
jgi:hypothetical protein